MPHKVVVAALGALVIAGCEKADLTPIKELAAKELECDAAEVTIVSSEVGASNETYEVAGCDKTGTVLCSGNQTDCVFAASK